MGPPSWPERARRAGVFRNDEEWERRSRSRQRPKASASAGSAEQRTLLLLDGVEPLQPPPGGFLEGRLQDPAIEALLVTLAQSRRCVTASALCVVTTASPSPICAVSRRAPRSSGSSNTSSPSRAPPCSGMPARSAPAPRGPSRRPRAKRRQRGDASEEMDGHALTLQLLGSFLCRARRGDIRKRSLVRFDKADAAVQGGHAFRVMGAYENWLAQGREEGMRQLAVLRLLGLFDRPADPDCLAARSSTAATPTTRTRCAARKCSLRCRSTMSTAAPAGACGGSPRPTAR